MEEFKSQCVIDYLNDPLDHNLRNKAVKELTKVHKFLRKMTSGISGLNRFLLSSCLSLVRLPCLALLKNWGHDILPFSTPWGCSWFLLYYQLIVTRMPDFSHNIQDHLSQPAIPTSDLTP